MRESRKECSKGGVLSGAIEVPTRVVKKIPESNFAVILDGERERTSQECSSSSSFFAPHNELQKIYKGSRLSSPQFLVSVSAVH